MVMIEKMKFLSITGPKADIDRMTETYLSKYEIHLENALSELTEVANLSPFLEINPYKEALSTIDSFYEQLEDSSQISPELMDIEKAIKTVRAVQDGFRRLEEEKSRLQSEHAEILDPLKIIRPFKNLNFDVSEILNFKYIHYRFGRIEKQYLQKFEKYIYDNLDTLFIKCGEDEMYVYGVYFVPEHQAHKVHAVYSSMHFERIFIPNEYHGTAAEAFEKLDTRHREIHKALDANKEASHKFLQDNSTKIVSAKAALDACSSSFDIRKLAACTPGDTNTFYILCGWMTEKDALAFQKDIQNDEKIFCLMEDQKAPATQKPPTKLRNPKLFKPFEMYVKMYGLPAYNEMDPTWFVAITYSFIFGAMFGDVGQGLVLFLGGLFLYKTKKMDLAGIISCAGVFSVFFGFMYGSFFGFEDVLKAIWLKPMNQMMDVPLVGRLNAVFVIAIGFGMFIILICMVFNIINSIRRGDTEKTWFDSNAVAGLVFYGSIVLTIGLFISGKKLPAAAILVIMFGVPLLLMFLKEPLTNLVEKKSKILPEQKGMFFVQSFFELFEVLLSYLSNTLSFLRIGAFAVSHAAMMEVVLMLAGATNGGNPNWIVVVLGNIFVCAMEGLIVGIQVLRLEYYEIFSRFYAGNGREFKPFMKAAHKN
ncbi:V-type ATPase 116kDa subunit family protein [Blautia obeum ATCC 29174]|jgi:V/A-type H+-transporting ATPase subunit I|uniref:V-type ATPase 116kDa subunit family protein n=2 Tax=Blautia obeum TaxID=40520 RepID=A5ZRD4_9FIRM|nr:V-type ATPase 116kDa subunit family protein [Blautia obeum ATCC 29174]